MRAILDDALESAANDPSASDGEVLVRFKAALVLA